MNTNNQTSPTKEQVYNFLHILRLSGITNMYGAGPYIQEVFDVSKYDANRFLMNWMETFSEQDG
jgi:hypothetical protein